MTSTTQIADPAPRSPESPAAGQARATTRDPRLDFFRGLAMFVILIAHVPGNWLTLWIPARFGFSDATETFVFCSGMASAIAFGRTFERRGWWLGTARVAFRCWQVYWAHIGLFLVMAAGVAAFDLSGAFDRSYVAALNLGPLFDAGEATLLGLMTLTYVPNYFDILPMYLVILALMPLVVALRSASGAAAVAFVAALWLAANLGWLDLPADPASRRTWFFNPFGWQLVFFTGFALMAGWLPAPPVNRRLIWLSLAVVVLCVPLAYFRLHQNVPVFAAGREAIFPLIDKTPFGLLRYVHFLATAYLAWVAVGPGGARLIARGAGPAARAWRGALAVIMKVGQQSLAVFIFSMIASRLIGVGLNVVGRDGGAVIAGNLLGFASLIAVAYVVGWFRAQPWRSKAG